MEDHEIKAAALDWQNEGGERDCRDDLYVHFADFGRWNYFEISEEALRVLNVVDGRDEPYFQEGCLIDDMIKAVASHAYDGALAAVAVALGVHESEIHEVVSAWYDHQDSLPPPVTPQRFMELCAEA